MPDEKVDKWRQEGRLYLWRYLENARNYPGWQFSAEPAFRRAFDDLVERMLAAPYGSQKTLIVSAPPAEVLRVPNNRGGRAAYKPAETFSIKLLNDESRADFADFEATAATVSLAAGRRKLETLKSAVLRLNEGENDYALELGAARLWFW